jgi:hypothetical protein
METGMMNIDPGSKVTSEQQLNVLKHVRQRLLVTVAGTCCRAAAFLNICDKQGSLGGNQQRKISLFGNTDQAQSRPIGVFPENESVAHGGTQQFQTKE